VDVEAFAGAEERRGDEVGADQVRYQLKSSRIVTYASSVAEPNKLSVSRCQCEGIARLATTELHGILYALSRSSAECLRLVEHLFSWQSNTLHRLCCEEAAGQCGARSAVPERIVEGPFLRRIARLVSICPRYQICLERYKSLDISPLCF